MNYCYVRTRWCNDKREGGETASCSSWCNSRSFNSQALFSDRALGSSWTKRDFKSEEGESVSMVRTLSRESVPRGGAGSKALTKEGGKWLVWSTFEKVFFFFYPGEDYFFFFFWIANYIENLSSFYFRTDAFESVFLSKVAEFRNLNFPWLYFGMYFDWFLGGEN